MSESEESDGEGGIGNLNRLIVRPPGHSGKAKRGHLCFDSAFEGGNLGRADHITELEYDLYLRPDTCRPASRFSFYFTVENVKQDQRVILNIVNFGKWRTLYCTDMTPIVKSTFRPKWQRVPRRYVFYHRSAAHRGRHILSIAFVFDRDDDVYHFASTPPYTYSRLQKYLSLWQKKAGSCGIREQLAETAQKRRVDIVTVSEKNSESTPFTFVRNKEVKKRRVVLVISRCHGGQTPTSHVCQGFLDYLISSTDRARSLRHSVTIKVVPMLNPDGVYLGNFRSDYLGSDLNRSWLAPTSYSHPALVAIRELVKDLQNDKMVQLDFIVDIHCDMNREGVFVHGNSYNDVYRFERHIVLPKVLSHNMEGWSNDNCHYNVAVDKAATARRTFALPLVDVKQPTEEDVESSARSLEDDKPGQTAPTEILYNSFDSFTLLVSAGGRRLKPNGPYIHYTEDAYFRVGKSLGRCLYDFYRNIGVLKTRECSAPRRKTRSRLKQRRRRSRNKRNNSSEEISVKGANIMRSIPARQISPPISPLQPPLIAASRPSRHLLKTAKKLGAAANNNSFNFSLPIVLNAPTQPPKLSILDLSASIQSPKAIEFPTRRLAWKRRKPLSQPNVFYESC